ncbi:sensor histidine kinase [Streptococcus caviae]|uniref:sensor histidine kinase n=1 Tax=Streptococcus sp. 'caviae' TaxID=1915004 RepID=UPI00094B9D2E|nr:sensor histidine kinase [Streptococcus sp. 'caviae']OLN84203.1 sensor histidine kinase [Streptococcus sp. 'caviae']
MFRPFQKTDPLYYVALVFMIFPLGGVSWFGYPLWTLLPSVLFALAFIAIIHIKDDYPKIIACLWFYLLGYIVWISCFIEGSMMWFFFFLVNLLVWRFGDKIKSYRFISFLLGIVIVVLVGFIRATSTFNKVYFFLVAIFVLTMLYTQHQTQIEEQMKRELYKQNEAINLLAAENERNRIGRDLHDTLGHTFAMMTLKTELALKQLNKQNTEAVRKELLDLNQISKESMKNVRELINNLKYRTVTEELAAITEMFALSDIGLTVENTVNTDQLSPVIQSSMTMILRELTNNVIKHSKASACQIHIFEKDGFIIKIEDNGCGFDELTGKELSSIRERLYLVNGQVDILSSKQPTVIQIRLKDKEN